MSEVIKVNTLRPYEVKIGSGILDSFGAELKGVHKPCRVALVTDSNVEPLYAERAENSLKAAGFDPLTIVFPAGEQHKKLSVMADILEKMAEGGLTRSDMAVALGGGVTGDMAGFAASVYQRGIPFAQIPTTLLAAVDSSVGGKTAVDLRAGKNLAGVFSQPIAVYCDTDSFNTLTPEIFSDGMAESIKYGVLTDRALFDRFRGFERSELPELVARCVRIKADYVERDELDFGDRRFLNLGHTLGHAIEKLSGYTFSHGHAVAVGMVMIARAGEKLGITGPGTASEIAENLRLNRLPVSCPYGAEELYAASLGDKKRMGGSITIIVPEKIGSCRLIKLAVEELRKIAELAVE